MKALTSLVIVLATILSFTSCNTEESQWARIGVESGNNNKEIYRHIPTQFWITAPEGEQVFVRSNQGVFLNKGQKIDGITGFTVTGIGEGKRIYFDIINSENTDIKIDVSYPNSGTNSLQLKSAVNPNYIEVAGGTISAYSEVYHQDGKRFLRVHVLGNNIPKETIVLADYIVNGYIINKNSNGYLRGTVECSFNTVSGVQSILEALDNRSDGLSISSITNTSISIASK